MISSRQKKILILLLIVAVNSSQLDQESPASGQGFSVGDDGIEIYRRDASVIFFQILEAKLQVDLTGISDDWLNELVNHSNKGSDLLRGLKPSTHLLRSAGFQGST